jgi:hypothetical protein
MGILSRIKGAFKRKKDEDELPPIKDMETPAVSELGEVTAENVKAKMELMMTRVDSLSTQYAAMNERIKNIERLVTEIRSFCR